MTTPLAVFENGALGERGLARAILLISEDPWTIIKKEQAMSAVPGIVAHQSAFEGGEQLKMPAIRIGISACLLGQEVRYDGGHKHDRYLTDTLGQYFEWVPVCPQVEVGLTVPRPTMRLEMNEGQLRLFMPKEGKDLTRSMRAYAKSRVRELEKDNLSGYLLKKGSPSSGMERVRVYQGDGRPPTRNGRGLFAEALLDRFPNLPVEDIRFSFSVITKEVNMSKIDWSYHRQG